jgi:hypothetical protein
MDEEVIVTIAFFCAVLLMIKMILDYKTSKIQAARGSDSNSLGKTELKALLRDAVRESNLPLENRIKELEAILKEDAGLALPPKEPKKHLLPAETTGPDRPHMA